MMWGRKRQLETMGGGDEMFGRARQAGGPIVRGGTRRYTAVIGDGGQFGTMNSRGGRR